MLDKQRFVLHFEQKHRVAIDQIRISGRAYPLIFWGSVLQLPVFTPPAAQGDHLFQLRLSAEPGLIVAYDGWCKTVGIGRARGLLWLADRLPSTPALPAGWQNGPIAATAGYSELIGYRLPAGAGISSRYLDFFNQTWRQTLDSISR